MQSSKISSDKAPKPVGLYPHARKVGDLLFLSGVGPRKANSGENDSDVPGLELDHNGNFKSFDFVQTYNHYSQSELPSTSISVALFSLISVLLLLYLMNSSSDREKVQY